MFKVVRSLVFEVVRSSVFEMVCLRLKVISV